MPSSTGPSPLFVPLHPSPRLVAQMTGLTLEQSELEVEQQYNLKRMLRRIRASRRRAPRSGNMRAGPSPRAKGIMPTLQLPDPMVIVEGEEGDSGEWSDTDEDPSMLRKMDVFIDISDNPGNQELRQRVARLFEDVFGPSLPVAPDHVTINRLSGAMTNCIFMVTVDPQPRVPASRALAFRSRGNRRSQQMTDDHALLPRRYLLRVYGSGVDEFLSREKELYWLDQLTSLGFGPQLYGIFGNGRLEEYLESTTLGKEDIWHQSTSKHIARRMSELHNLVSTYRPFRENSRTGPPGSPDLWRNIDSWLELVNRKWDRIRRVCAGNPKCMELLDNWPRVEEAGRKLRGLVEASGSPVVFTHNDLQYGNILRLEATGELIVIDFEYAGYSYRGFDVANHFCEWMADYHHDTHPHLLDESRYPSRIQRQGFLRTYVKAKAFLDANMKAEADIVESDKNTLQLRAVNLSEERIRREVERLELEIGPFVPASHFHWGVWGLLQAVSSDIDFDYVGYASQRLSIFMRQIAELT
ncbi:hypothetical protein GGF46_004848 [Coemansia sp. RSA 552]|nr:hypothetical protein GGF46_004848 [Coemansia sp. RSA 552]